MRPHKKNRQGLIGCVASCSEQYGIIRKLEVISMAGLEVGTTPSDTREQLAIA